MKLSKPPLIAVVAYNRPKSLSRLLFSLSKANYGNYEVPLVISIDKHSANHDVVNIANDFEWPFGRKVVIYQDKNLGLREHIIKTGKLSYEYESIILLEDDLFVAPGFYKYAIQSLNFSLDKDYIGGISLYNYQFNPLTGYNFQVNEDGYDNWYFQYASSWGQAWTKNQFQEFLFWYDKNPDIQDRIDVPQYVRSWSNKSWLKYYISYLMETNRFFLYPKIALSTNFDDMGTHVGDSTTVHQIPLSAAKNKDYYFSEISKSEAIYDAFFENLRISDKINIPMDQLKIDLNGYRHGEFDKQYIVTTNIYNFKIIKSFARKLKPIENNVFYDLKGNKIFIYDTSIEMKNPNFKSKIGEIIYSMKYISLNDSYTLFAHTIKTRGLGYYEKIIDLIRGTKKK